MFSYEIIPAVIGWTGVVFRIVPIAITSFIASFSVFCFFEPFGIGVDIFHWSFRKLSGSPYNYDDRYDYLFNEYDDDKLSALYGSMLFTAYLIILLLLDIMLIQSSKTRNHKKLIPSMIVYGISFVFYACISFYAYDSAHHFGVLMSTSYSLILIALAIAFQKFHKASKDSDEKKQFDENITSIKLSLV